MPHDLQRIAAIACLRVLKTGSTRSALVYADAEYKVPLSKPGRVNGYGTFPPMYGTGAFRLIGAGGGRFHNAVVTIDAAGSGQPFNVLSPFLLVSIYIKH